MALTKVIAQIDKDIARLQQARKLLAEELTSGSFLPAKKAHKQRVLTPEGRKRIADAVRRRWERQRALAQA